MKTKFEIKTLGGSLLFTYEADSLKDAVVAAVKRGAYLWGAYLRGANLWGAYLQGADLQGADLRSAYLRGANLRGAYLQGADLQGADLQGANLQGANLRSAYLRGAYLQGADLWGAYLRGANLWGAYLQGANLQGANLRGAYLWGAKDAGLVFARTSIVPESGPFFGWKKCRDGVLVQLAIGSTARRSSASGRKCRAERVKVLQVIGAEVGISLHDGKTEYRKGQIVTCDKWNEDRWTECDGGIHFYITRLEAEDHQS